MNGEDFLKFVENKVVGHISDSDTDGISCRLIAEEFIAPKCKTYIPFNTADRTMDEVPRNFYDGLDIVIFSDIAPPNLDYYNSLKEKNLEVFIFDHHETSKQDLGELPYYYYSITKCGTKILYDFLTADKRKSKIIQDYVNLANTYDLWKTDSPLWSAAKNLVAVHFGYIDWWKKEQATTASEKFLKIQHEKFKNQSSKNFYFTMYEQQLIVKAKQKEENNYKQAKKNLQKRTDSQGVKYLFTECNSKISLTANRLLKEYADYEYIIIRGLFDKDNCTLSLRSSRGYNVSQIAKKHGGGGHEASAGMSLSEEQYFLFKTGKMQLI